jgi:hypothetical protein
VDVTKAALPGGDLRLQNEPPSLGVSVTEPTTVRLYPLGNEHTLPLLLDAACFAALMPGTAAFGRWWFIVALVTAVAAHVVQMAWLVAVRFDDAAITIIRPWRRRRIPWDQIAGLIYTQEPTSLPGRDPYRLRLVLKDDQPPAGRFLTGTELKPHAKGPVVMTLYDITPGSGGSRTDRCQERVHSGLEQHGITRPEPYPLRFHSAKYTNEEEALAMAADLLRHSQGTRPVTVNHPAPRNAGETHLIDTVLPELAAAHGTDPSSRRTDRYSIFFFQGPDAEQSSARFIAAAQAIVPARWPITPTALPEPTEP